jgi:hypothetical protein
VRKVHVLKVLKQKHSDFGPTLAAEYPAREDGEKVAVVTLNRCALNRSAICIQSVCDRFDHHVLWEMVVLV